MRHEIGDQTPSLDISGPIRLATRVAISLSIILTIAVFVPVSRGQHFPVRLSSTGAPVGVSFAAGGKIEHVHVTSGSTVKPGDLLISLQTEVIGSLITKMKREADVAQEEISTLKAEAFRLLQTTDQQASHQQKLIDIERRVTSIEMATLALNARIENAERDLRGTQLRAPVAGRVMDFLALAQGDELAPNVVILRIAPNSLDAKLLTPLKPAERQTLKVGQPVSVSTSTLLQSVLGMHAGTITSIAPSAHVGGTESIQISNAGLTDSKPYPKLSDGAHGSVFVEHSRAPVFDDMYKLFFNAFERSSTVRATTNVTQDEKS
jgi:multidrug efflux pump subunit AcrA (membrane-fusion protein)